MAKVSGTVYRHRDKERVEKAVVVATKDDDVKHIHTDADGHFSLEDLAPGKWTFVALHKEDRLSDPQEIELLEDVTDIEIGLFQLQDTEDKQAGYLFFIASLIALGALVVLYFVLHLALSRVLSSSSTVFFWDQDPGSFLEVLLWGLAGILVNKIFITGWYLRSQRFYREGILMHVAHIVVTPLLALVAVLLLSLVALSVTLAGSNELTLDLSDPRILVAVSFVLGTIPWPLWSFIENTGKRIAGQVG